MKTILIIDDREGHRELVRTILQHFGYTVIEAWRSNDAVTLALYQQPDVILLDRLTGANNGLDLLSALRSERNLKSVPIVAMLDSDDPADMRDAIESGFTSCLLGPLRFDEIRQEICRLCIAAERVGAARFSPVDLSGVISIQR